MVFGFLDHLLREGAATGFAHIGAELGHHRANALGAKHSARKRCCRDGPPGALQKAAPAQAAVRRLNVGVSMGCHTFSPQFFKILPGEQKEMIPLLSGSAASPKIL